ncbi:cytochrome c biogenesis protein CcsA [Halocola ammonii]
MDIDYTGESPLPGIIGNFFIVLAFAAALFSAFSYYQSVRNESDFGWKRLGRIGFWIQSLSILGAIASLFYILTNHLYEYQYAWEHLNNEMPMKYILSCFWEGQEGSFLLWIFWHIILGNILIFTTRNWESGVMGVFALVQVFLISMLLGIFFGDYQLGSNPFLLLREAPSNVGLPWTQNADYLQMPQFQDGRGLNPLLQNYWMTIHPPTLFLGFASTLVPFAYAIAGLWRNDFRGWIAPAIPWAFFSVMILGTGILMGGAWAYEALSFGGFWAWDPVENASLVPWLTLVGAAHLLVINKRKPTSLFTTFLLVFVTFVLILYSTFLTRSGVLGDTSVHSFVDSGILPQLLVYLLFFVALSVGILIRKKKERTLYAVISTVLFVLAVVLHITADVSILYFVNAFLLVSFIWVIRAYRKYFPPAAEEENLWSREFWVFLGSLVLFIASLQIIGMTSFPVINKMIEPFSGVFQSLYESSDWGIFAKLAEAKLAPPSDPIPEYNKWQIPFAVIIMLLIASGQFFKYKKTNISKFGKDILGSLILAVLIFALLFFGTPFGSSPFQYQALLFSGIFAFTANLDYMIRIVKGKLDHIGSSVSHIGFALLLIGALVSTSQSEKISQNRFGDIRDLSEDLKNQEDMILLQGDTMQMGNYFVNYKRRFVDDNVLKFEIEYFNKAPKNYKEGDVVYHRNFVFQALQDHEASNNFLKDMKENWTRVPMPNERQSEEVQLWKSGVPGEYQYSLHPRVQLSEKFENTPEPDTRHYLDRDLYTHIKWGRTEELETDAEGYLGADKFTVAPGDTIEISGGYIFVDSLKRVTDFAKHRIYEDDLAAKAVLRIRKSARDKGQDRIVEPLYILRDTLQVPDIVTVDDLGYKFKLDKLHPESGEMDIIVWEHKKNVREFIVMQAIVFPYINILWIGCIIMVIGTILAIRHRIKLARKKSGSKR